MKLVLFDCDGVLINSEAIAHDAQRDYLASFGLVYDEDDYNVMMSGHSYEQIMEKFNHDYRALTGDDLPADFAAGMRQRYHDMITEKAKIVEGVRALVDDLKQAGVPFCVASNSGRDSLIHKLKLIGLYDDFHPHIFSRDDVKRPKPAPDIYLHAARTMGVASTRDCVVVEDSPIGVRAGVAAGMYVAAYCGGDHRPENYHQLLVAAGAEATAPHMDGIKTHVAKRLGQKLGHAFDRAAAGAPSAVSQQPNVPRRGPEPSNGV